MLVISFIAAVFLTWPSLLKHHFNTALESAEYHLLVNKNHLKSRWISICIVVVTMVQYIWKRIFKNS